MPDAPARSLSAAPLRPSFLRQANARGLLALLRAHAPCSKADLVRYSGLSAPTVSSGIAHLQSLGLVKSMGDGESSGGRPPGLLRFNAARAYVAAADIGGTRLRMLLADLNGATVAEWKTVLGRAQKTPEAVCDLLRDGLRDMCGEAGISQRRVLHLTAGAPGITDVDRGFVLSAPNLKRWNEVPLRAMLRERTGLAVTVENDTNLAAVGEHWSGAAQGVESFVFIAVGTGVGAGIFLRGQLYHGAQWMAGEIGYGGVGGEAREPMRMRETGQLERALGGGGIERRWAEALAAAGLSNDLTLTGLHPGAIFDRARDGHPVAREVLRSTARLLADAIADVALLLNPQLVVLGGGVGSHPELCRATQECLERHELARPELRPSALGTEAQLAGAVSLSLAAAEAHLLG